MPQPLHTLHPETISVVPGMEIRNEYNVSLKEYIAFSDHMPCVENASRAIIDVKFQVMEIVMFCRENGNEMSYIGGVLAGRNT